MLHWIEEIGYQEQKAGTAPNCLQQFASFFWSFAPPRFFQLYFFFSSIEQCRTLQQMKNQVVIRDGSSRDSVASVAACATMAVTVITGKSVTAVILVIVVVVFGGFVT